MHYGFGLTMTVILLLAVNTVSATEDAGSGTVEEQVDKPAGGQRPISRVEARILQERELVRKEFALLPHKPNYALLYSYNEEPNLANWLGYSADPDQEELIIQLSLKYPIWVQKEATVNRFAVFAGYTQKAFWQAYNKAVSRPFRETNHEPELLIYYFPAFSLGDWKLPFVTLGINHQSNGQSGALSRSWNRVYLDFVFARGDYAFSLKPWYRIPEDRETDDNRHILDYMGHGEITLAYGNSSYDLSLMLRNNFKSDNKGAGQIDFSFPITENKKLSFYLQLFHGYGESLIDYDYVNSRIGVGILSSNWL